MLWDCCRITTSSATRSRSASHKGLLGVGTLQPDAREILQPVSVQSMPAHRLVQKWIANCHERVAAARRGKRYVSLGHVDAVYARNERAALHTEQLHIRVVAQADENSLVIQRATDPSIFAGLHALRLEPLVAFAAQCHQPVGRLSFQPFFARTHAVCPCRSCDLALHISENMSYGLCTV